MTRVATLGAPPAPLFGATPARIVAERLGYALFALFVFFTSFTFLKPSPYDFTAIPTLLLWAILGLRIHRGAVPYLAILVVSHVALILALIPYFDEPNPTTWTIQSLYLFVTAVFFVMFFSDDTHKRVKLAVDAYVASCVFASIAGIISYVTPTGIFFTMDGRAAGVFEDPNLLGSFLTVGGIAMLHRLLARQTRHPILSTAILLLILTATLLAFSRGAWGAMAFGALLSIAFTYRTSPAHIRRRITILAAIGSFVVAGGIAIALADPSVGSTLTDRFTLTKDYDEGETGRFGNQKRSIPLLMERPNGFGPLRFRLRFGFEPHNSYIGGFANGGWLGGFSFIALVLLTTVVGVRLCLTPSPYRTLAQGIVPPTLMFFMQAFQIDIEHWRHVYIMFGMVWGLECARLRWLAGAAQGAVRNGTFERISAVVPNKR
jgi:hypothetical protein